MLRTKLCPLAVIKPFRGFHSSAPRCTKNKFVQTAASYVTRYVTPRVRTVVVRRIAVPSRRLSRQAMYLQSQVRAQLAQAGARAADVPGEAIAAFRSRYNRLTHPVQSARNRIQARADKQTAAENAACEEKQKANLRASGRLEKNLTEAQATAIAEFLKLESADRKAFQNALKLASNVDTTTSLLGVATENLSVVSSFRPLWRLLSLLWQNVRVRETRVTLHNFNQTQNVEARLTAREKDISGWLMVLTGAAAVTNPRRRAAAIRRCLRIRIVWGAGVFVVFVAASNKTFFFILSGLTVALVWFLTDIRKKTKKETDRVEQLSKIPGKIHAEYIAAIRLALKSLLADRLAAGAPTLLFMLIVKLFSALLGTDTRHEFWVWYREQFVSEGPANNTSSHTSQTAAPTAVSPAEADESKTEVSKKPGHPTLYIPPSAARSPYRDRRFHDYLANQPKPPKKEKEK